MSNRIRQMAALARPGNSHALSFNGTNNYVSIPHDNTINTPTALSAFAWIKAQPKDGVVIVGKYDFGIGERSWALRLVEVSSFNRLRVFLSANGSSADSNFIGNNIVPYGTWHHVGLVYDSGTATLYVDGEEDSVHTNLITSLRTNQVSLSVGAFFNNEPNLSSAIYDGLIDQVRLYNRALSPGEALKLSRGVAISRSGLVGHWPLNEGSGTTARDVSGNGNNGTISGATYTTDKPF